MPYLLENFKSDVEEFVKAGRLDEETASRILSLAEALAADTCKVCHEQGERDAEIAIYEEIEEMEEQEGW